MRVDIARSLDVDLVRDVRALVDAATAADGVTPLSEQGLLDVRHGGDAAARHVLAYDGSQLAGYAHLDGVVDGTLEQGTVASAAAASATAASATAANATAEIVVHPGARRRGIGTILVRSLETVAPQLRLWAHGHLAMAREFAARDGYGNVRELWQLTRPLGADSEPLPPVVLPDGFAARTFGVDRDEQLWLTLNALAFAGHPEQGSMTLQDLREREAEPWFDPAGLILVMDRTRDQTRDRTHDRTHDQSGAASAGPNTGDSGGESAGEGQNGDSGSGEVLAASHWTKVHAGDPSQGEAPVGEVYVVAVDPAYQGRGLGRAVTVLGLEHLQGRGLSRAMLYVDGDNATALAIYERLGFTRFGVDVMYSRGTTTGDAQGVPR